MVRTPRLVLRPFTEVDREPFFELHTHPAVVEMLGSSPSRTESDAMLDRYTAEWTHEPWGRWAVEVVGDGYATEGTLASLRHGFEAGGLDEIVAFTTTLNTRSQAVMVRLGMVHDPSGDFDHANLPEDSPLRRHVLFRVTLSHLAPTVAP